MEVDTLPLYERSLENYDTKHFRTRHTGIDSYSTRPREKTSIHSISRLTCLRKLKKNQTLENPET